MVPLPVDWEEQREMLGQHRPAARMTRAFAKKEALHEEGLGLDGGGLSPLRTRLSDIP
jgi:hypothetical protein